MNTSQCTWSIQPDGTSVLLIIKGQELLFLTEITTLFCVFFFFFLNAKFWQTSSQEHKNLFPVPGHRWRQRILLRSSHTPAPRLTSRSQQYWVPSRRVTVHWAVLLVLGAFREAFSAFSSLVCTSFVSLFAASSITSASCVSFTFSPSLSCLPSSTGCWGGKKKLSSW